MSGEGDLARLLAALRVSVRDGEFVFLGSATGDAALAAIAEASIRETEGVTYVLPRAQADARALGYDFIAAWLTLDVHSALDAIGLTATVAGVLAERGIPCNVLAGLHHDHLLVAADRRDDALATLERLAAVSPS